MTPKKSLCTYRGKRPGKGIPEYQNSRLLTISHLFNFPEEVASYVSLPFSSSPFLTSSELPLVGSTGVRRDFLAWKPHKARSKAAAEVEQLPSSH